ncbi:uncharacterized protein BJ212DRAFT_1299916 [Suillus subaureus]|uniref:Uncharacterized protein n=1 Tax=Suillus subaureus TaxID=48587 RepID=A0A9P7EAG6_9AGAM|nr:uncharacterized protein BJ212DRAFT_1299916 [Suillus subaureus]KAG1816082.1 hypothetical protein BJ212DRAFT_1299916 [Suillus subaureus]
MAHIVNANPADDDELDNDPGAYIVRFGKHAGKQLDSIPTDYRLWATAAECQHFHWRPMIDMKNNFFSKPLKPTFCRSESIKTKDSTKYQKITFVPKPGEGTPSLPGQGSTGVTRSVLPTSRRGFINFCLRTEHSNFKWYHKFEDLVRRYKAHLATHRRPHRRRKPANVQNPAGELLGSWDDRGSVEPGGSYMRDGFVVNDGEGEDEYEDSQEEGSGSESDNSNDDCGFDDDFQGEEVYDDSEVNTADNLDGSSPQIERSSRTCVGVSQTSDSDSDSDDDTFLDELPKKIRAKRVSGKRKAEPSRKRRKCADHSMSCLRIFSSAMMTGPRLVHDRPTQNDFHSGAEPVASTSHLDEQESPYQLSRSESSQESSASSSTANGSQIEDESSQATTRSYRMMVLTFLPHSWEAIIYEAAFHFRAQKLRESSAKILTTATFIVI